MKTKKIKNRIKIIIGCVITLTLTVLLVLYAGHRLDAYEAEDGYDAIKAFHSLDEDSLDVIVYGSSHAWKGFDTGVLNEKYDISAYNYACNWQAINTSSLFLQDSLTTQSPKVVCIETHKVGSIEQDMDMDGQIYYTRQLPNSIAKLKYLYRCFKTDVERYVSYVFPLTMFHDNWNIITDENYTESDPQRFVDSYGYYQQNESTPCSIPDYTRFEQEEIGQQSLEILDAMVELCKENGITVIFFTVPWEGEDPYIQAMTEYAESRGCVYINFFDNLDITGISGDTDFHDAGHLNDSGAGKVADYIGNYIIENNLLD